MRQEQQTNYKYSRRLREKVTSICPVLAFSHDGTVLKSNITGVFSRQQKEIDGLLCQRLKAVQLLIEAKDKLIICKENASFAMRNAAINLHQIEVAIASLDNTIDSLQPRAPKNP